MRFTVKDFIKPVRKEPDETVVKQCVEYYFDRLRKTGYERRGETQSAVKIVVRYFAELMTTRILENRFKSKEDEQTRIIRKRFDEIERKRYIKERIHLRSPNDFHLYENERERRFEKFFELNAEPIEDCRCHPPLKGCYLLGSTGTGKTTLLQRLSASENTKYGFVESIGYYTASELTETHLEEGDSWLGDWLQDTFKRTIIIDELGGERFVKRYGGDPIMSYILENRYETFCKNGVTTTFATNLDADGFADKYGERVASRLQEMTKTAAFIGEDWRTK